MHAREIRTPWKRDVSILKIEFRRRKTVARMVRGLVGRGGETGQSGIRRLEFRRYAHQVLLNVILKLLFTQLRSYSNLLL